MSYIKYKDRLFQKKSSNPVRKRSDCNLRKISSCNDCRAWSLSAQEQRDYLLHCVSSKSCSTVGKYVPPRVIIDILRKQDNCHFRRVNALKRSASEESFKRRNTLSKRRSRISLSELKEKPEESSVVEADFDKPTCSSAIDKPTCTSELNNLRSMVKDLQGKLTSFKELEEENSKLKSELRTGIEKLEYIQQEKEFVQPIQCSTLSPNGEHLAQAIDLVKNNCYKMRSDVEYLQLKNSILSKRLKKTNSCERVLRDRELGVSLETVNSAILKNQLINKDVKISKLASLNGDQRIHIEHLACQMKEMSVNFAWREEVLVGKLLEFKKLVESRTDDVTQYEKKLLLSHSVIKELDVLGQHFRKVNHALREEASVCRNRFKVVARKAVEMANRIELLLDEIAKRDVRIKELSKFPGRSSMAVRLSQLDNFINGDFIFDKNKNNVVESFEKLKQLLKKLKNEAWEEMGYEDPLSFTESFAQCTVRISSIMVQCSPRLIEVNTQTDFPDHFILEFLLYTIFIVFFNYVVIKKNKSLSSTRSRCKILDQQVAELSNVALASSNEIDSLKTKNSQLEGKINSLNHQLYKERLSSNKIAEHSENELESLHSVNDLFFRSLLILESDYDNYCKLLEEGILVNEEKLEELTGYVESELWKHRWQHTVYLNELEVRCQINDKSLENEIKLNWRLMREIENLTFDMEQRDKMIDKLNGLWTHAERNNEQLRSIILIDRSDASSQVELFHQDCEIMTEIGEPTLFYDKEIEVKLEDSLFYCRNLKKIVKSNACEDNRLRKKLCFVNMKVKRISNRVLHLRDKLDLSVENLKKLKESNTCLVEANNTVVCNFEKLKLKNSKLKDTISALRADIANESSKNDKLQESQLRFLEDFQRIHSELIVLKESSNKTVVENGINTDLVMFNYETTLESKNECISQLKERIEKLLELLKVIENEKKLRESNINCQSIQCVIDDGTEEKYTVVIKSLKEEYEKLVENLKRDHTEEKENKEKYYRNNLNLLKDTYERDIKRIKIANADSLKKIQSFHEDEIKAIRNSLEFKSKTDHADSNGLYENHELEMERLKSEYEKMLQEKSESFIAEKEVLQNEMKKYMAEKEAQVEEITKKMEEGIKLMKKKCKVHMRKVQKENSDALEQLRKEYTSKTEDNASIDTTELYSTDYTDKDYSIGENEETITKDDTFTEARTDTSGFEDDIYDPSMANEKRFLLKRIEELEEELSERAVTSSENACDSEKRIWVERERCREMTRLLDKEIEKSESFRTKLHEEKEKVDRLSMINQALLDKIHYLEHKNEGKDVESFSLTAKDQLSTISLDDIYSYESSDRSDFIDSSASSFKYL